MFIPAMLLAVGALCISVYLSYVSLAGGVSPAGCGYGSGCAEVLASKWSRVGGVPVSLLAVGVYAAVLVALPLSNSSHARTRWMGKGTLAAAWWAFIASAIWFTYLQLYELRAVCPYCIAVHVMGIVVAVLLAGRVGLRYVPAAIGLLGAAALITVQLNSTEPVATLQPPTPGHDSDITTDGVRVVSVLGGAITLNLNEEPVLGSPDAEQAVIVMYDYACPHCRHTHEVIRQYQAAHPRKLVVVLMPTPLNPGCNPHAPEAVGARFEQSCELARIAITVFLTDPAAFPDFDRWLFESTRPRTAEAARAEAFQRVGREVFEQHYLDPRIQHMITRNVHVYGQSGADRVPVLIVPGSPAAVGRIDHQGVLTDILDAASTGGVQ